MVAYFLGGQAVDVYIDVDLRTNSIHHNASSALTYGADIKTMEHNSRWELNNNTVMFAKIPLRQLLV